MTDDSAPPKPRRRLKRNLLIAGAGVGLLSVVLGVGVVLVMKVEKVHAAWCNGIGVFCVKAPQKVVASATTTGCPDFKMRGSLEPRAPNDPVLDMVADVNGRVSLTTSDATASGSSQIACYGGAFLATFSDMSDDVVYQCLGAFRGATYTGVCNRSRGGSGDIKGDFTR